VAKQHLSFKTARGQHKHSSGHTNPYIWVSPEEIQGSKNGCLASAGLLPQTGVWREWESSIVEDIQVDPKKLYNAIQHRQSGTSA
jgi:hypothetical protein